MKTHARLITLGALLGFMFAAVSCTTQQTDKYTATTGITPSQTAFLAGKWWMDYEQAKASNVIQATKASPVTSTKDVIDPQPKPQASLSPAPVSSPSLPPDPEPEPGTIRRPDAHHRLQLASLTP